MIFEFIVVRFELHLIWLKTNNKWYRNADISQERLSQLPVDGNLEARFWRGVPENTNNEDALIVREEEREETREERREELSDEADDMNFTIKH